MDISFYQTFATYFRKAFEDLDLSNAPGNLPYFPVGCCLYASIFIGQFLLDEYKLSPQHVCAQCHQDDGDGHEWIEVENIIIDITADQFNKYSSEFPKVMVCNVDNSEWHSRWESISKYTLFNGFLKYDEIAIKHKKSTYTNIYNLIRNKLKKAKLF